ncbi:BatD family protein [Photobacterium sp. 53610]|uniref:BatD family protein n=1 Tax=Photobacterium sp. 53610 TaxID=3102789 RepID=UPI002EDABCDD
MNAKHFTFIYQLVQNRVWAGVILLIASLLSYSANAAQVVATVSSNQVGINEIFELKVSIDDSVSNNALDLSPLKKDFTVGTPSTSSFSSFVNGSVTRRTEWRVALAAKSTGKLTIPAFRIGATRSDPIVITVSNQPGQTSPATDLAIEVTGRMDKDTLYVGESQIYQVQIKIGEQIEQASLASPQGDGIDVVQVGKDHQADTVLNGRQYTIINRKYRITATKPGNITLQGAKLTGTAFKSGRGRSVGLRIPVNIQAEPKSLAVKGKPDTYQGLWLPTADLQLSQQWQNDSAELKVGEPVTRVLTLKMKGTPQSQLPDLSLSYPDSVRVYSEKPVYSQESDYSVMTLKQVIIPRQSGAISLPALKVNWWNTEKGQQQQSLADGKTLQVKPDSTANASNPQTPSASSQDSDQSSQNLSRQSLNSLSGDTPQQQGVAPFWPWLTLIVTMLWIITLVLWLRARKFTVKEPKVSSAASHSDQSAKAELISAVQSNQPMLIQTCYQRWDKTHLTETYQQDLETEIARMMRACYGKSPTNWDNRQLLALLKQETTAQHKAGQSEALAPLVPDLPPVRSKG